MNMRKAIVAFLAAICILASVCTFGAFAEGTSRVYAETNASAEQGSYGYCYVYLDDLTDLASLNVAVHYDAEKVTVTNNYNQVACSLYDASNANGCLQYSYIFDGEGSNTKTNLFYFCYQVNDDAEIGNTYFDIVVTDAYNTSIQSVEISGSRCNFTITEKAAAKTAYVYGSSSVDTSVKEEFEIAYSLSDWQIASGSMVISYDPELFEFVEITNGEFLNGKIVDVNSSLDGSVYLSFLATEYNYNTELLKVKFRTLKNVTETTEIKLTVSELYDLELSRIVCGSYTTNVTVTHDATYTEDSPSMSLSASYNAQTDKVTVTVLLEKDSHLGAGDFVLNFDTKYLTYSSATKGFAPSFFNINDKNVGGGILKFSIISLADITDGQTVLTVVFDVQHSCEDKLVDVEISGSGLADSLTNPILLNFVDASVTIPMQHIAADAVIENKVDATCVEDGHYDSVVYCSACGDELTREEKTIDKVDHARGPYGYCMMCEVSIERASIGIGKDLSMRYYVALHDESLVGNGQMLAMQFTMNGVTTEYIMGAYDGTWDAYVFSFDGIAPHQMTDVIDATLAVIDAQGAPVRVLDAANGQSIMKNAEALLERYADDETLVQLVVDMLTYGAAAQTYRSYKTDSLATQILSAEMSASDDLPTSTNKRIEASASDTVYFMSATVWFDTVNRIGVKLSTTENVTLKVNGKTVELTGNTYYTDAIVATGFDTAYVFELYEGDTPVQTLTYSVNAYVYAMTRATEGGEPTAMAELAKALYNYGVRAKAYIDAQ